jgi:hypothetical protein
VSREPRVAAGRVPGGRRTNDTHVMGDTPMTPVHSCDGSRDRKTGLVPAGRRPPQGSLERTLVYQQVDGTSSTVKRVSTPPSSCSTGDLIPLRTDTGPPLDGTVRATPFRHALIESTAATDPSFESYGRPDRR